MATLLGWVYMKPQRAAKKTDQPKQAQPAQSPALQPSSPDHPLLQLQQTVGNQAVLHLLRSGALQTKLAVSQPGDVHEQEAERVAQQVMRMPDQQSVEHTQTATILRAKAVPDRPPMAPPAMTGPGSAVPGGGQPLPASTRAFFEPRFGQDFSQVRVHNDARAAETARAVQARAYTMGQDVVFGAGQYAPETGEGRRLLAHELTHVVQQRPGSSRMVERAPQAMTVLNRAVNDAQPASPVAPKAPGGKPATQSAGDVAPGVMDLKGPTFEPPAPIAEYLAERKDATVNVRLGKLAQGPITVRKSKDTYSAKKQSVPLTHPLFARIGEALPGFAPSLIVSVDKGKLEGYVGVAAAEKLPGKDTLRSQLKEHPELLGLVGFKLDNVPKIEPNSIEGGSLHIGLQGVRITLGSAFGGTINLAVQDETIIFDGSVDVSVKGLATGKLDLQRSAEGLITGKANVGLTLPKNITGSVDVAWDGQAITGEGKVGYQGEKLSGEVTLRLMDKDQAAQLEQAKKAPPAEAAAPAPPAKTRAKKVEYVVFGEGDLIFAFNEWLNGTAHVIIDPKGFLTVIGKITPQKEFELFEQKDYIKPLFKVEARAAYGIPVVGNIFIFANIGMDAFAKLGPAKFYNIVVEGTYSTDPQKSNDFSIRGSLNISAAAGLRLRGEAGAGLEILDHDIKAGAGINGIAGIRGYAEATPIIGYREKAAEGEDKKGEFFIRGELEIAAQPFLGLSGDLFVELDSPWWSPAPDKKWTWPLGSKEWPIGGSFGIGASVDYVFGSKQLPSIEFKPVDFSAEKFMTDLYTDKAQPKSGEAGDQKGAWKEKNSKEAEPPKVEAKGDAAPGKPAAQPPAQPTVKPGGGRKPGKLADPNAKTAEGKSIKELQEEASKKGKKPVGKEPETGTAQEKKELKQEDEKHEAEAKESVKEALNTQLPKGARQLEEVKKLLTEVANRVKPALTSLQAEEVLPGKPKQEGALGFKVKGKTKNAEVLIATVRYAEKGTVRSHEERWQEGVEGVKRELRRLVKREISAETILAQLPRWQTEYGFTVLRLQVKQTPWIIEGAMSNGSQVAQIPGTAQAHTGLSKNDAIPITWFKSPDLYVPSMELPGLRITIDRESPTTIPLGLEPGQEITIGVPRTYWPRIGKTMQYIPEERGRAVEQIRAVLDFYGLRRRALGVQMDHVQDLQFEGPDQPENVWPFDSSANMSAGPRQRDQQVTYLDEQSGTPRQARTNQLPGRWFRIADIE
jgi:hypothetical protein